MRPLSIGHFQIEAEAASGATGTVYQALDRSTGGRVAVKVMRGLVGEEAARFNREATLLARIRHPGVVRYVGHGTTAEGDAYLVMEWLEGEDVRSRLRRAGLSLDETVALGRRVAEALAAIHALGVVHRDIKPANLFLPGGLISEAKIVDFGLVRGEQVSVEVTRTGVVLGTPSYMSPEQARGEPVIDARSDVFSLGCVLYKCLSGHAPFEGTTVIAVLTKVLLEEAPGLLELRPGVPPALNALVARMIAKDPEGRPRRAAAVAEALAAIAQVGDAGTQEVLAPASSMVSGLTAGEQRVSAVILVGARAAAQPPAERTLQSSPVLLEGALEPPPAAEIDLDALVHAHGGQLDTLLDGTRVVTLPARGVATDQAALAARCALALREAMPGAPIAIATGFAEVGPTSRAPAERTGDAIERAAGLLAAQVEVAAAGGVAGIAVDETTAALLGPRFEVAGTRGELCLVGSSAAPAAPRLLGRATPMVGREWELGAIRAMFTACVDEREPRTMLVTAAAGMGKSRLAYEAVPMLADLSPDLQTWWGRGDPMRSGSALGLLGQILRSAAGVREGAPLAARRRSFLEGVAAWVPVQRAPWMTEVLGEIAGVPFHEEGGAPPDARVLHERRCAAWEALVAGATARAPLLLVIDDAQWADAATMRLVGAALKSPERRPWMVLALGRPEVREAFPRLWDAHGPQEIRLGPLTRRAGERVARAALGEVGEGTLQHIVQQADGNAFYLEELIRAVADVAHPGGRPRAPSDGKRRGDGRAPPPTVLAMVQARLEALDAGTRRVLRAASVFGEVFWASGVAALLGGSRPAEGWIEALVERELCVPRAESRFAGERELAFRHALVREGAYAMLTEGDRALGHALAGEWLEAHGEADAMVLAGHFEAARDEARAAHFYGSAAREALRAADLDAAIARAARALAAAPSEAARIECSALLAEAHAWRDEWARAAGYAEEVTRLSPPGSAPWIQAMAWKQSAAMILGRVDDLLAAIMALVTVDAAPGTAPVLVPALMVTAFLLGVAGQLSMAAGVVARMDAIVAAEDAAHAGGYPAPAEGLLLAHATALAHAWVEAWGRGDAWAALRYARASMPDADGAHDARHARFVRVFVGMSLWLLGLLPEAEAELRAGDVAAGGDLLGALNGLYLALVLLDRGALDEVRALAARRIEQARASEGTQAAVREAEGRWLLGEAAARSGDLEAAERELTASLAPLRVSALVWQLAAARLVAVRLSLGRVPEALSLSRELHEAFTASGGHGLRGTLVRLVHAEALDAAGEAAAARAILRDAWDDLQARAARIDDAAVRRRFLEEVPENARVAALAREWLGVSGG